MHVDYIGSKVQEVSYHEDAAHFKVMIVLWLRLLVLKLFPHLAKFHRVTLNKICVEQFYFEKLAEGG